MAPGLPASTWSFAFSPHLRAECLAARLRAAHPRSLCFGGGGREPTKYNDNLATGLRGEKVSVRRLLQLCLIQFLACLEKRKSSHAHTLSPSDSPGSRERPQAALPSWGSLAACHCCIMAGCCGRSPSPGRESESSLQGGGSACSSGPELTQRNPAVSSPGSHLMPISHWDGGPRIAPGMLPLSRAYEDISRRTPQSEQQEPAWPVR